MYTMRVGMAALIRHFLSSYLLILINTIFSLNFVQITFMTYIILYD